MASIRMGARQAAIPGYRLARRTQRPRSVAITSRCCHPVRDHVHRRIQVKVFTLYRTGAGTSPWYPREPLVVSRKLAETDGVGICVIGVTGDRGLLTNFRGDRTWTLVSVLRSRCLNLLKIRFGRAGGLGGRQAGMSGEA